MAREAKRTPTRPDRARLGGLASAYAAAAGLAFADAGAAGWPTVSAEPLDLERPLRQLVAGGRAAIKLIVTIRAAWSPARANLDDLPCRTCLS